MTASILRLWLSVSFSLASWCHSSISMEGVCFSSICNSFGIACSYARCHAHIVKHGIYKLWGLFWPLVRNLWSFNKIQPLTVSIDCGPPSQLLWPPNFSACQFRSPFVKSCTLLHLETSRNLFAHVSRIIFPYWWCNLTHDESWWTVNQACYLYPLYFIIIRLCQGDQPDPIWCIVSLGFLSFLSSCPSHPLLKFGTHLLHVQGRAGTWIHLNQSPCLRFGRLQLISQLPQAVEDQLRLVVKETWADQCDQF